MKAIINTVLTISFLAFPCFAADVLKDSYTARLSAKDHFNSNGVRLTSVAAIIRQDRANYHKLNIRDEEDQNDSFFASANNRELLEKFLERGSAEKAAIQSITNGTPLIQVRVYTSAESGHDYIRVSIIGAK